jgi:6-phosphogluconolactonase (cycloisomerase 2 family)
VDSARRYWTERKRRNFNQGEMIMFNIDNAKNEFLITNEASPAGVKSVKMRVDHSTRIVTYAVHKDGLVQVFTNLVAAVKRYNG